MLFNREEPLCGSVKLTINIIIIVVIIIIIVVIIIIIFF